MNLLQSYVLSGGARGGKLTKLDGLATGQWKAPREPLEGLLCPTFDCLAFAHLENWGLRISAHKHLHICQQLYAQESFLEIKKD